MIFSQSKLLNKFTNLLHCFTTRKSGNLAFHVNDNPLHVEHNHETLAKELNYDKNKLIHMKQIHSNTLHVASEYDNFYNPKSCDALITNKVDTPLMVMVADCSPILFYDDEKKVIAVAHAGRAGTFKNINKVVVNSFTEKRWLFTRTTSNGFIPGEAAACLILSKAKEESTFIVLGCGKAEEPYTEGDEKPFLAVGMTEAIAQTLKASKQDLANIHLWFSHNATSFLSAKEITLAELKLLRGEGIEFQRHSLTPFFGEVGAAAGLLMLILGKDLVRGRGNYLTTMANLGSRRAAILTNIGGNHG